MKCNAKLRPNYFSVNAFVLTVAFHHKFQKPTILPEIVGFLKFVGEIQQLVRKRSQKNNQNIILHSISLPIYPLH